jgi:hypothetical protein
MEIMPARCPCSEEPSNDGTGACALGLETFCTGWSGSEAELVAAPFASRGQIVSGVFLAFIILINAIR